uniref:Uncharacterized protein n=1 Tax=Anguilla anguilla TaxID=7936 RepID=A0A0E9PXY5_ANGAN
MTKQRSMLRYVKPDYLVFLCSLTLIHVALLSSMIYT